MMLNKPILECEISFGNKATLTQSELIQMLFISYNVCKVVKIKRQPVHFTGYFEYEAGYSECW